MEIIFHPLVRTDVEEALSYYQQIATRLADEFRIDVREVINRAMDNPLNTASGGLT